MFHCCIEDKDQQPGDQSTVEGPPRKTAKGAIKTAVTMAIREGLIYEKVRLIVFEDGCELLRAYGDTPQDAKQSAINALDRNRRRY